MGRPRKDGPRWPSGNLIYSMKRARCACGQSKCIAAKQCRQCADRRRAARPSHCPSCGGPKWAYAIRCQQCDAAARRGPQLWCEWCGQAFWRRHRGKRPDRDARRFCSKRCSGQRRTAAHVLRMAIAREQQQQQRAYSQEERAQQRAQLFQARTCSCGSLITRRRGRWCNTCFATRIGDGRRAARAVARSSGLSHICPNCGQGFCGYPSDTFCSSLCAKQMRNKRSRGRPYPSIQHLATGDRNRLAEMIALVRAANRRIAAPASS